MKHQCGFEQNCSDCKYVNGTGCKIVPWEMCPNCGRCKDYATEDFKELEELLDV